MILDWGYVAIMLAAIATAAGVRCWMGGGPKIDPVAKVGLFGGAFVGAMIGAKLPFVLTDWPAAMDGSAWYRDGKTILAGLAGGYIGVEIAKWCFDIKARTGDSFAVPVAASIAVGRWGCLRAGCCYGTPTDKPWGIIFRHVDLLPRHPTQIYESMFHATAAVIMLVVIRREYFGIAWLPDHLFKAYLIAYAIYRIGTETIRPEPRYMFGITAYQWTAMLIAIVMIVLWRRGLSTRQTDYPSAIRR